MSREIIYRRVVSTRASIIHPSITRNHAERFSPDLSFHFPSSSFIIKGATTPFHLKENWNKFDQKAMFCKHRFTYLFSSVPCFSIPLKVLYIYHEYWSVRCTFRNILYWNTLSLETSLLSYSKIFKLEQLSLLNSSTDITNGCNFEFKSLDFNILTWYQIFGTFKAMD